MRRLLSATVVLASVLLAAAVPQAIRPAAVPNPLRILSLGDSLTAGYGSTDGLGYRRELDRLLTAASIPHVITTTATVGATTADLLMHVVADVAAAQPDVVLLSIGTNDAVQSPASIAAFESNYDQILTAILAAQPGVVVVASWVMYSDGPAWFAVNEKLINDAIYRRVYGGHVGRVVGIADLQLVNCRYVCTADHVHPGNVGYDAFAWEWWRALGLWLGQPWGVPTGPWTGP